MQWSRAKTIIIALLVAVNLFLLVQIISVNRTRETLSADYVSVAAKTLSDMGLNISADAVPTEIKNLPGVVFTRSTSDYDMLVTHIFSTAPRQLENDILVEDGSMMGMYYKGDAGIIKIMFDGQFRFESAELSSRQISLAAARRAALNFAFLSGLDGTHFAITSEEPDGDGYIFEIAQLQNAVPIREHGLTVKISGGGAEYAFGRLLTSAAKETPLPASTTSVNALFSVAAYYSEEKTVRSVALCYYPVFEDDGALFTVTFTPAYEIDFENGDSVFYLTSTGQIIES